MNPQDTLYLEQNYFTPTEAQIADFVERVSIKETEGIALGDAREQALEEIFNIKIGEQINYFED
jgi:hypothetical protein